MPSHPQWECPTCNKGLLEVVGKFEVEENAETIAAHEDPEFGHDFVENTISAKLKCNNKQCLETVFLIGKGHVEQCYDNWDQQSDSEYLYTCKPECFFPHLKIFNIPDYVPEVIEQMLDKSFALFFSDSDSCGNRIRACIEILLNEQGVPDEYQNADGKTRKYPLHQRIESQYKGPKEVKDSLLAIKWLGNIGSHGMDGLSSKDTLDAYKIIQHVFELIYKPASTVNQLVQDINKARGPVLTK